MSRCVIAFVICAGMVLMGGFFPLSGKALNHSDYKNHISSDFSTSSSPGIHPPDTSLTERVRKQLQETPDLNVRAIDLRIHEEVVVLSGTVDNLLIRDRVTRQIQQLQGVRSVVNNLVIKPTRPDKLIEQDLKRVLKENPTTLRWNVWGDVEDNVITLDGLVSSWRERNYITQLCKGIKGVRAIRNNIELARQPEFSDSELEKEIEQYLKWDNRIDDARLDVIVNQKKAILVGTLPNAYQKQLAVENSHIPGIAEVKSENLDINPSGSSTLQQSETARTSTPEQQKEAIRRALDYDPRISDARSISMDIQGGTVSLSGTVDNLVEKLAIGEIATQTVGIREVNNMLTIDRELHESYPVPVTDQAILRRLHEALQRDTYLSTKQINVSVDNGVIQISGSVGSKFEKMHAGKIASQIMGTIAVDNDLKVREGT